MNLNEIEHFSKVSIFLFGMSERGNLILSVKKDNLTIIQRQDLFDLIAATYGFEVLIFEGIRATKDEEGLNYFK